MGYRQAPCTDTPRSEWGEAEKKGERGNHNSLFLQQARTAGLAATRESDLREQTPPGFGGPAPPFPMDAARGAGSGCEGGALTLQLSQMPPNIARFHCQGSCRRAVQRG